MPALVARDHAPALDVRVAVEAPERRELVPLARPRVARRAAASPWPQARRTERGRRSQAGDPHARDAR